MNRSTLSVAMGLVILLAASLFSYARVEEMGGSATMRLNVDGGALATIILGLTLFLLCRRILAIVRIALRRAGLPPVISILMVYRWIIGAAIPFLLFGYSTTTAEHGTARTFGFGISPMKLSVFALVILVIWLITLSQRLRDLSEYLQRDDVGRGNADGIH